MVSSLLLPGRAVSGVRAFKCHSDPDLEQAGGDPGSGFVSVSAYAVSYKLLKWKEIKASSPVTCTRASESPSVWNWDAETQAAKWRCGASLMNQSCPLVKR